MFDDRESQGVYAIGIFTAAELLAECRGRSIGTVLRAMADLADKGWAPVVRTSE